MATGLELYEALKPTVGEEAAKMIAETMPMGQQVATKADVDLVLERVEARLSAFEARMFRWMLGFFATLWVAQAGMIAAILTKL